MKNKNNEIRQFANANYSHDTTSLPYFLSPNFLIKEL